MNAGRPSLAELLCPRDCPKRCVGCHSDCERHALYRAEAERLRAERMNAQLTFTAASRKHLKKDKRFV